MNDEALVIGFDPDYDYAGLFSGVNKDAARANMENVVPPEHRAHASIEVLTMRDGSVYTHWQYKAPRA